MVSGGVFCSNMLFHVENLLSFVKNESILLNNRTFSVNNLDLYLKLAGKILNVDTCPKLHERMEGIKSERERTAETYDRIKIMEEEKRHLLDTIESVKQNINTIR